MHTPGPWNANNLKEVPSDRAQAVWTADATKFICATQGSPRKSGFVNKDEAHANCLLIAAAPELLKSLEWAVRLCDANGFAHQGKDSQDSPALAEARAAIRKAKGE